MSIFRVQGEREYPDLEKKFNAVERAKELIKAGDRITFVTPASGYETGSKQTVTEGTVTEIYPFHIVVNNGRWNESFTWAELIRKGKKIWINGKRFEIWEI